MATNTTWLGPHGLHASADEHDTRGVLETTTGIQGYQIDSDLFPEQ